MGTGAGGLVHRFGELSLAATKLTVGECQKSYCLVTLGSMDQLLFCPDNEALALGFEKRLQVFSAAGFDQQGFLLADHIEIHQCDIQRLQRARLAEQPTINLGLRPVQVAVVVRLPGKVASVGFDFFQLILRWIVAIGAAAHV